MDSAKQQFTYKDAGVDTTAVVRTGMIGFMEGCMLHGIFHGDLHGGNLFVLPDARGGGVADALIEACAERCRERRMAKRECSDYADEDLYQ